MTVVDNSERLSAYLDGALSEAERREIEAQLASDAALAAELEELRQVDAALALGFGDMLAEPVPLHLARAIEVAVAPAVQPAAANTNQAPWWRSLVASVALVAVGAVAGAVAVRSFGSAPRPRRANPSLAGAGAAPSARQTPPRGT